MAEYKQPKSLRAVIKKDRSRQDWEPEKIVAAAKKSAARYNIKLSDEQLADLVGRVVVLLDAAGAEEIEINELHKYVEMSLDAVNPTVAKSYREFRDHRENEKQMFRRVWNKDMQVRFLGDFENANKDSALIATQQALLRSAINKEFYLYYDAHKDWVQAHNDGFLYIHDTSDRRDGINCCLFDLGRVLQGGFEMANMHYNEPGSLDTFFDVAGDVILAAASQQYGGFTIPEVDKLMSYYAEKSYLKHCRAFASVLNKGADDLSEEEKGRCDKWATDRVIREMEQGIQGWEYKFNTVGSSRGDYPFITVTLGLAADKWGKLAAKTALKVHSEGQGEKGKKRPVLFPKYVFLYDEKLHGEGCPSEDVFLAAIECSMKTMYPDYLSMTGEGYIASMYKEYGKPISPMGCRAFLSPWWEKGGFYKADEEDTPVFVGRFNIGVVSLNLPLIFLAAKRDGKPFFALLDHYLQMIREIHLYTYAYLSEKPASIDPLGFCEGGFYRGTLNPDDKIKPCVEAATASFGITALNELQEAYNGKSLVEDGAFALETLRHINEVVAEFKKEDGRLYAIYGTPAENLTGVQARQIKEMFGFVPGVSDREYVSNSFHCGVWEDITPIQKQDLEYRFWELCNGGKIQYCKYPVQYNRDAVITLVRRAMGMGLYEGVNLSLSYCNDCGQSMIAMGDECPHCHSRNLTKIERMNGYLAFSRVSVKQSQDGTYRTYSRLSKPKMAEIGERLSM